MEHQEISKAASALAQFACDPKAAHDAARYLTRHITNQHNSVPILSTLHISADIAGSVTMTATNLDQWASVTITARVEVPGAVCIEAANFADAVGKLVKGGAWEMRVTDHGPGETSFGRTEPHRVSVSANGARAAFKLSAMLPDDFPLPPTMEIEGEPPLSRFTMPAGQFLADLATLAPCMSTEETRYYLCGVAMQAREMAGRDRLMLVATDGKALGAASRPIPAGAESLPDAIIPDAAVSAMHKAGKMVSGCETVAIAYADRVTQTGSDACGQYIGARFRFDFGALSIWSKAVDGTFPQWERIFDNAGEGAESQLALFPELLPGVPLPTMGKLEKGVPGGITWTPAPFGLVGTSNHDPNMIFSAWRDPSLSCAKRGFNYRSGFGYGEIIGPDGVTYPVAFSDRAIHLSAAQVRELIGESCFETMAVTMPDGTEAHILRWLWEDGASRFLTVRPDGRCFGAKDAETGRYVTREEIERGPIPVQADPIPVCAEGEPAPAPAAYAKPERVRGISRPIGDAFYGSLHEEWFVVGQGGGFEAMTGSDPARWHWHREGRSTAYGDGYATRDEAIAALESFLFDQCAEIDASELVESEAAPYPHSDTPEPVEALSEPEIAHGEPSSEAEQLPADPVAALEARIAALEAMVAAMQATPTEAIQPSTVEACNVIPLPVDPRATAAARARLEIEVERARPKRTAAHERAIRRAWAERKRRREAERCRDSLRADCHEWEALQHRTWSEAMGYKVKRRRAVLVARRMIAAARKAHAFERDRANVLASQLAGLAERVERMEAGLGARYPIAA